jgi:hypothetical protein
MAVKDWNGRMVRTQKVGKVRTSAVKLFKADRQCP